MDFDKNLKISSKMLKIATEILRISSEMFEMLTELLEILSDIEKNEVFDRKFGPKYSRFWPNS